MALLCFFFIFFIEVTILSLFINRTSSNFMTEQGRNRDESGEYILLHSVTIIQIRSRSIYYLFKLHFFHHLMIYSSICMAISHNFFALQTQILEHDYLAALLEIFQSSSSMLNIFLKFRTKIRIKFQVFLYIDKLFSMNIFLFIFGLLNLARRRREMNTVE